VSIIAFRWLASLEQKGEGARWHFGVIAQQVRDAFAAHGMDGTRFGLLCYDEWGDEYEKVLGIRDNLDTGEQEEFDT
ncbi:tail fiber domain-containing protein, partial [Enterobacter roggenkampii]